MLINVQSFFIFFRPEFAAVWEGSFLHVMTQISDYLLIVPVLTQKSRFAFITLLYILDFLNLTAFILVFLVSHHAKINQKPGVICFVSQVIQVLLSSSLTYPLIFANLTVFKCSKSSGILMHQIFSNVQCFKGLHIANFIIAIISLIVVCIHNIFLKTYLMETQKSSTDPFSRIPQSGLFEYLFYFGLIVLLVFFSSPTYKYLLIIYSLMGALWNW